MSTIDHDQSLSTAGTGETFEEIIERRLSRRAFLKSAVAASTIVIGASVASTTTSASAAPATQDGKLRLSFSPLAPGATDAANPRVADGHTVGVLLRWGDPISADAPAFDPFNQTVNAQSKQFGYNNDFVGFLPVPFGSGRSDLGLLVVNHEYTNPELMFPGYSAETVTQQQVDIQLAAHGLSVVQVRHENGTWVYDRDAGANRRITGTTPMTFTGPAAESKWLKTSDDSAGTTVLGTLNNCSGGITPWGTVVSGEENFNQYFANLKFVPTDDPRVAVHTRYGLTPAFSERRWENFYARFDLTKEPNEPFRYGWAVEIDPFDPGSTPKKRTALGRFKHEAVTFVVAPGGQVVAYQGDDERFDYVYKFISAQKFNPSDRSANKDILDAGTLYVAKFNDDGSGQWIPLIFGQGALTAENGFSSQADVLVKTRLAGDAVGATKMDRPEDIETNPVNKKVYMVMTNNDQRGAANRPGTDKVNPRAVNRFGHIIEVTETNNDAAATSFSWDIFLLAGKPDDASTYFAGYPKDKVSPIGAPDNIAFDKLGNLWIATDGQPSALKLSDGFFAVPVDGAERGYLRQFFSAVAGSEVCGPEFTPDSTSVFLAIQHPGEGGTFEKPVSLWPDGNLLPRPSVIAIQSTSGGPIGTSGGAAPAASAPATGAQPSAPASGPAPVPAQLPNTGGEAIPGLWPALAGLAVAATGALLRRRSRAANHEEQSDAPLIDAGRDGESLDS